MRSPMERPFQLGQIVYSKIVRDDGKPIRGMVTGIMIRPHGIAYLITWPKGDETQHFHMELTAEKPELDFDLSGN